MRSAPPEPAFSARRDHVVYDLLRPLRVLSCTPRHPLCVNTVPHAENVVHPRIDHRKKRAVDTDPTLRFVGDIERRSSTIRWVRCICPMHDAPVHNHVVRSIHLQQFVRRAYSRRIRRFNSDESPKLRTGCNVAAVRRDHRQLGRRHEFRHPVRRARARVAWIVSKRDQPNVTRCRSRSFRREVCIRHHGIRLHRHPMPRIARKSRQYKVPRHNRTVLQQNHIATLHSQQRDVPIWNSTVSIVRRSHGASHSVGIASHLPRRCRRPV